MPSNNKGPQRHVHRQAEPTLRATTNNIEPAAYSASDAATYCGLRNARVLAELRQRGDGPPFVRLGHRTYVYAVADLDAWMAERRVEIIKRPTRRAHVAQLKPASPSPVASTDGDLKRRPGEAS